MTRPWTIRDDNGVREPSSSLHVFMLGVLHGLTRPEAHARAVCTYGNGRAVFRTWPTGIDAGILLHQSESIPEDNWSAGAEQQSTRVHARCSARSYMFGSTHSAAHLVRQQTSCVSDMLDMNRCESTFALICIDSEVQWMCGGRTASCNFVRAS